MKDWLFSANQNRYIHRVLSDSRELEIDIDGTIYMHLKYHFNPVHFRMLKNRLDEMFTPDTPASSNDKTEYYYKGDVFLIGTFSSEQDDRMVIEFTCSSDKCLEAFLQWTSEPNVINTMEFLEKYCKVSL
jgi:hypothetical protein